VVLIFKCLSLLLDNRGKVYVWRDDSE